jgi:hypothetical protein
VNGPNIVNDPNVLSDHNIVNSPKVVNGPNIVNSSNDVNCPNVVNGSNVQLDNLEHSAHLYGQLTAVGLFTTIWSCTTFELFRLTIV